MTRFARAKGSKASNEREPEEATPWAQMKKKVLDRKDNPEDEDQDQIWEESQRKEQQDREQQQEEEGDEIQEDQTENGGEEPGKKKKKKRAQDKCLQCKVKGHLKRECPQLSEERRKELTELVQMKIERKGKGTGRKKNKRKLEQEDSSSEGEDPQSQENKKPAPAVVKEKTDKTGVAVGVGEGLFQGFRVKTEDVERLKALTKKLQAAKLPGQEIKAALKRERRKAEKELARSKKLVCFNCRQPGHLLTDCPLQKNGGDSAVTSGHSGLCFKCGSNDHTSKNCKSKRKGEDAFAFATCFICKERGHLAKSCPDNPKGLYPNGGGCRFCGSVEHLKSDCTRKSEKDQREEVRVDVVRGDREGLEDLPDPQAPRAKKPRKQVAKKVVVF